MKTRNKLLTLLILSAGAATATALINKAVKSVRHLKMYSVILNLFATNGDWEIFIIQKRELENLSCWFMT